MNLRIKKQPALLILLLLLIGIIAVVAIIHQPQDIRQRAACIADTSTCDWDPVANAAKYHYKITEAGVTTPIKEGDTDANTRLVSFPSQTGKTYTCAVYAISNCGASGPQNSSTTTCVGPNTPTPTTVPTATPTTVPTVTPVRPSFTPTKGPTPTPTRVPTPTVTPRATVTPTRVPTPTTTPVLPTPTLFLTPTPLPSAIPTPTITPRPTLPATGSNSLNLGIAVGTIVSVIGVALLFAL